MYVFIDISHQRGDIDVYTNIANNWRYGLKKIYLFTFTLLRFIFASLIAVLVAHLVQRFTLHDTRLRYDSIYLWVIKYFCFDSFANPV